MPENSPTKIILKKWLSIFTLEYNFCKYRNKYFIKAEVQKNYFRNSIMRKALFPKTTIDFFSKDGNF